MDMPVRTDGPGWHRRRSRRIGRLPAAALLVVALAGACAARDGTADATDDDRSGRPAVTEPGAADPAAAPDPQVAVGVEPAVGGAANADAAAGAPVQAERRERPPVDRAEAERAIAVSLQRLIDPTLTWDQRRAWVVGEPTEVDLLGPAVQAVATSPCAAGAAPEVRSVYFLDPTRAEVTFTIDGPSVPELGRGFLFGGQLVASPDGRWQAQAADVRAFVELVAPHCSR
jgi:hypothetical protein